MNSFFKYNLALQAWPLRKDDESENGPIEDFRILNYMPRKEYCQNLNLSDASEGQTRAEFCEESALVLENLARPWRQLGAGEIELIYYPDAGMTQDSRSEEVP